MKGKYDILVKNNRVQYKFSVERNITILKGDSATGKTTLIEMIAAYQRNQMQSGVEIRCEKNCCVIDGYQWEKSISDIKESIVFIDEGDAFVKTKEFAAQIKNTDNYYVIATRSTLPSLPYSILEIYGIKNKSGNRYQGTKRLYSEFYPLYGGTIEKVYITSPQCIVVEDSNSGYEFFSALASQHHIPCVSAKGKSNVFQTVASRDEESILVIADGAAFGPELERLLSLRRIKQLMIYLPESFEWIILKSGLIEGIGNILDRPEDYIESQKYFSWDTVFYRVIDGKDRRNISCISKIKIK